MERFSIGAVAKAANVSVDAVRYYERSGVIPRAFRLPSGYRRFSATTISRIRLVKSLQRAGFTLAEVRELFQVVDAGERAWDGFRSNLAGVLDRLTTDLIALQRVERRLRRMLRFCDEGRCPFLRDDAPNDR